MIFVPLKTGSGKIVKAKFRNKIPLAKLG